jgi:hypothetical protein
LGREPAVRALSVCQPVYPGSRLSSTSCDTQSLHKRALSSIFPGSYAHLSPKDTTESTLRFVSNGFGHLRERRIV